MAGKTFNIGYKQITIVKKIKDLLKEIRKTSFQRIGKPEPLKYDLKGYWSRRITGEHGLVYKVEDKKELIKNVIVFNVVFITINLPLKTLW